MPQTNFKKTNVLAKTEDIKKNKMEILELKHKFQIVSSTARYQGRSKSSMRLNNRNYYM
jgi:hypothetical protein